MFFYGGRCVESILYMRALPRSDIVWRIVVRGVSDTVVWVWMSICIICCLRKTWSVRSSATDGIVVIFVFLPMLSIAFIVREMWGRPNFWRGSGSIGLSYLRLPVPWAKSTRRTSDNSSRLTWTSMKSSRVAASTRRTVITTATVRVYVSRAAR